MLGGPEPVQRLWRREKSLALPGIRHQFLGHPAMAYLYTDSAFMSGPAGTVNWNFEKLLFQSYQEEDVSCMVWVRGFKTLLRKKPSTLFILVGCNLNSVAFHMINPCI
jgi:hypothetical protein